jgi:hypothetical protein
MKFRQLMIVILLVTGCAPFSNHSFDFAKDINDADLNQCNDDDKDQKNEYLDNYLSMHTIFIDRDGEPLKYENGEFVSYDKDRSENNTDMFKETQIKRILKNIDKFFESDNGRETKQKKILIYIHGGLNSHKESLELAAKRVCRMASSKNEVRYYPIFVNWDSEPFGSLRDHFFLVRQGEAHTLIGPLTSPIIALEDFGKIPIRALPDWYYQFIHNDFNTVGIAEKNYDSTCPQKLKIKCLNLKYQLECNSINALYCAAKTQDIIHISLDVVDNSPNFESKYIKPAIYFLTLPTTKLVLTPIVAELGRPAWDIMVRRTTTLFSKPDEFDLRNKLVKDDAKNSEEALKNINSSHTGALATFLEELNNKSKDHPEREIVLIGHSMGTIVLNNVIRDRKYIDNLNISDIVYMAAACSIRDFTTSVVPLLQVQEEFNPCAGNLLSHKTKFYNLTLHPISEASERNAFDLVQRGSLLEWIDNYYTSPTHNIDRTLGKWRNIIQSLHVIPKEIRYRVTIKGFGYGDKNLYGPQKHGEFNEFNVSDDLDKKTWNFWDEDFWIAGKYRYWMLQP